MTTLPFVLPRLPTTLKVRDAFAAALDQTPRPTMGLPYGWRVGLGTGPQVETSPGTLKPVPPPYYELDPLWAVPWGADEGMGVRRHEDVQWVYQFTCLALRADQLELMRDQVARVMLGKNADGTWLHDLDTADVKIAERAWADDTGVGESDVASTTRSDLRIRLFATRADT